jgi:hypothetical protein
MLGKINTVLYLDMVAATVVGDLSQSGHVVSLEAMHELKKGKTCHKITYTSIQSRDRMLQPTDSSVSCGWNNN